MGCVIHFFEQFEQRNGERGGLGLGLAICRGLVEAHNGVIRAASPGRGLGATFTVELPVIADAQCLEEPLPAPPGQQPHPWPAAAPHLRILLVEDHLDTAHTLSRLLSAEGHTVTVAHSLSSAIAESENPFDIIISDIGLPDGSGLDLMKRIPARPDVRAIALSGYGTDQDVLRSKEAGFDEHLTKPIDFDSLLSAIGRLSQQQLH